MNTPQSIAQSNVDRVVNKMKELYPNYKKYLVYFYDAVNGYSVSLTGGWYPTKEALFQAVGWGDDPETLKMQIAYSEYIFKAGE